MQAREMFAYLIGTQCRVKGEIHTVKDVLHSRGNLFARLDNGKLARFTECKFI